MIPASVFHSIACCVAPDGYRDLSSFKILSAPALVLPTAVKIKLLLAQRQTAAFFCKFRNQKSPDLRVRAALYMTALTIAFPVL